MLPYIPWQVMHRDLKCSNLLLDVSGRVAWLWNPLQYAATNSVRCEECRSVSQCVAVCRSVSQCPCLSNLYLGYALHQGKDIGFWLFLGSWQINSHGNEHSSRDTFIMLFHNLSQSIKLFLIPFQEGAHVHKPSCFLDEQSCNSGLTYGDKEMSMVLSLLYPTLLWNEAACFKYIRFIHIDLLSFKYTTQIERQLPVLSVFKD